MSDDDTCDRSELEPGLYVVDSRGTAPEGDRMSRLADKFSREVEEAFDPDALHDPEEDEVSDNDQPRRIEVGDDLYILALAGSRDGKDAMQRQAREAMERVRDEDGEMSDDITDRLHVYQADNGKRVVELRCPNPACTSDTTDLWFRDLCALSDADKRPDCEECGEGLLPPGFHAGSVEVDRSADDEGSDDALTCVFCGTSYPADDDGGGECPECGDEAMGGRVQRYDPMADEWS